MAIGHRTVLSGFLCIFWTRRWLFISYVSHGCVCHCLCRNAENSHACLSKTGRLFLWHLSVRVSDSASAGRHVSLDQGVVYCFSYFCNFDTDPGSYVMAFYRKTISEIKIFDPLRLSLWPFLKLSVDYFCMHCLALSTLNLCQVKVM